MTFDGPGMFGLVWRDFKPEPTWWLRLAVKCGYRIRVEVKEALTKECYYGRVVDFELKRMPQTSRSQWFAVVELDAPPHWLMGRMYLHLGEVVFKADSTWAWMV